MKNILILTNSFPCEGGEQFLETEIKYWGDVSHINIFVMPVTFSNNLRWMPDNVKLIQPLIKKWSNYNKFFFLAKSIISKNLWKEFHFFGLDKKKLKIAFFLNTLKSVMLFEKEKYNLGHALKFIDGEVLVYSYWNTSGCYAAVHYKRTGKVSKVISRAHGVDLYEERSKFKFLPLKRQFSSGIDEIYLLSDSAINYYAERFHVDRHRLKLGRLGVQVPAVIPAYIFSPLRLRVLSISYCVPVKRVDKILFALNQYAKSREDVEVDWTHVGAGSLYEELKEKADLIKQKNFRVEFFGQLSNVDVLKLLNDREFDIFINSSDSEGVPVSIMEAMSFGIPVVAPDVGGISDLVTDETGYLMPSTCTVEDINYGIQELIEVRDIPKSRTSARELIKEKFNADINYRLFIQKVAVNSFTNSE